MEMKVRLESSLWSPLDDLVVYFDGEEISRQAVSPSVRTRILGSADKVEGTEDTYWRDFVSLPTLLQTPEEDTWTE